MKLNWETKKLSDVCAFEKNNNNGKTLPYVGMEDIESNTGKFIGSLEPRTVKSSTFYFTANHLLYGRLRPYLNKVLLSSFTGHCSTEIFPIKVNSLLNRRYLFYWITSDSIVQKINHTCTGTRMPRANMNEVLSFNIPLPPVPEQKRIVKILDEAFAAIDKAKANAEKNLQSSRELFDSYLNKVFANMGDDWEEKKLGEITDVQSGGTPLKSQKEYWNGNIPWYSSGELNELFTNTPKEQITQFGLNNSSAKLFPKGSLLIGMYDTAALKMSITDRRAAFNQAIAGAKPNKEIDLKFVMYAIKVIKSQILNQRRGVRQKNLNLTKIKNISFFIPSLNKQKAIINDLTTIELKTKKLATNYKQKLADLEELKKALLQKAFDGKL